MSRYWPLLLIFLGLHKLWDYVRLRNHPEAAGATGLTGATIAVLIALLFLGVALSRECGARRDIHDSAAVERQGAQSVRAHINMPAGELKVVGGATQLLEADFHYAAVEGKPKVAYDVSGSQGQLTISQHGAGVHFSRTRNAWDLRLNNEVPMELGIEMGAGQSDLRLRGLSLTKLNIEMGAGQLAADLTGDWKNDLDTNIQGGVGSATIRLPKNVGVRVHATGGIGTVNARGLSRDGDAYVNDAYGKSAVTLRLNIEGGVGEINLLLEP